MSIRTKMLALILAVVILTTAVATFVGRRVASNALEDQAESSLEAIVKSRVQAIENVIDYQRQNIELLVNQANVYFGMLTSGSISGGLGPDDYISIGLIMGSITAANENIWQALSLNEEGVVKASAYSGFRSVDTRKENAGEDWSQVDWDLVDQDTVDWGLMDTATIDWAQADLSKVDWSLIDMGRVDWGYINSIDRFDWSLIRWEDVDLNNVSWSDISWNDVNLGKIDWTKLDLSQVDWQQVDVSKMDLASLRAAGLPVDQIDLGRINWENTDLSDKEFFEKGKQGTYVGAYPLFWGSTEFILVVAAPYKVGGETVGVMAYLGGEETLREIAADRTGLGDTGETYIVDESGYMLTPSLFVENAVLKQSIDLPSILLVCSHEGGLEAIRRENYIGEDVVCVAQPISGTGWALVVEQSRSEVLGQVSDFTRNMFFVFLGLVGIWVFIAGLLSRAITQPIIRLRQGAERIMNGDWDYPISTSATDEVGDLSRAFSAMTSDLRQSQDELRLYSNLLEEKVTERTEELSATNRELKKAREGLEERVWERTRELAEVNKGLQSQIKERKKAEQRVRNSLAEKEVLLKEIHHRVKNNLQIISSLLNLQKSGVEDKKLQDMFDESGRRVRSMALIHEQLYNSDNLAQIDFPKYVQDLSSNLLYSYGSGSQNIELTVQGSEVLLGIDMAVPCGLMINELITNSIKYAFPERWLSGNGDGRRKPRLDIFLARDDGGNFIFEVSDNGIGLPQEFDFYETETLGMQLVSGLADQLEATVEIGRRGGTTFRVTMMAGSDLKCEV